MKEVLVTGGAGFIGSHIQDRLLDQGHAVSVVDNLTTGSINNVRPEAKFYLVDIRDRDRLAKVIGDVRPDVIFHLAAQSQVPYSMDHPQEDNDVNVGGTVNLLELARGTRVEKIIYSNTGGALYGEVSADDLPIDEDAQEPKPTSFYGLSKLTAERNLRLYGDVFDMDWVSLRYANVYGPRQTTHSEVGIISTFIDKFLHGVAPTINGDGLHTRDYVYVGDVVDANLLAMDHAKPDYFNISSGIEVSNLEIYRLVTSVLGISAQPTFGPERPGDVRRSVLASGKAQAILGWSPKISLQEGISATIAYFQEQ